MSPAVLDRPTLFEGSAAGRARTIAVPPVGKPASRVHTGAGATAATATATAARARLGDGGPTIEGVIAGVWEGLAAHHVVGCPVCGGHMAPRYGAAGMAPVGGRCTDCGTTLG